MHDVFISYAHVDNLPPKGNPDGWVTAFEHELNRQLSRLRGRMPDIFVDYGGHRLEPDENVDRGLMDRAANSRTIVVVMSKGYLKSHWCQIELLTYLGERALDGTEGRVFVVEVGETDRNCWHQQLRSLTAIRFLELRNRIPKLLGDPVADPKEDSPYFERVLSLAHYVSEAIERQELETRQGPKILTPKPIVWIATVPEGDALLQTRRHRVSEAMRQIGAQVLPRSNSGYTLGSAESFKRELLDDLDAAPKLLLQLCGSTAEQTFPDLDRTPAVLQHELATAFSSERGVLYRCWRPISLNPANFNDPMLRKFLAGAIASSLEEFITTVRNAFAGVDAASPIVDRPRGASLTISIGAAPEEDKDLVNHVSEMLARLEADSIRLDPLGPEAPYADQRKDTEQQALDSDGVMLIYGATSPAWVRATFAQLKKVLAPQRAGTWGAVLHGPPEGKPDLGIRSRGLMVLDCRESIDEIKIRAFLDALRGNSTAPAEARV